MKNSKIKSEIEFIKMISKKPHNKRVVLGIGDDAAVIKSGNQLLVITTDMFVEKDHFSLDYFYPEDIGIKAMEANVSDIAAMGAKPLYAFISISLHKKTSAEFIRSFYNGIYKSAKKHRADVLGGDTSHGSLMTVNITLIGEVKRRKDLCLRSDAKTGDLIFVTGKLGASTAGLNLFLKKKKGFDFVKSKHLRPKARMDLSGKIAEIANAMEDVSDGLASEVRNICLASKKGAVIFAESIPIHSETKKAAEVLKQNALDYALFGGEDFELVFTVNKKYAKRAEKLGKLVGKIIKGKKIFLEKKGRKEELKKFGYDHFA